MKGCLEAHAVPSASIGAQKPPRKETTVKRELPSASPALAASDAASRDGQSAAASGDGQSDAASGDGQSAAASGDGQSGAASGDGQRGDGQPSSLPRPKA